MFTNVTNYFIWYHVYISDKSMNIYINLFKN